MIATAVGFAFCPNRSYVRIRRAGFAVTVARLCGVIMLAVAAPCFLLSQTPEPAPVTPPAPQAQEPPAASPQNTEPIAIVPIEAANRDQAQVSGGLQLTKGTAAILNNGTVTSGSMTTNVILPHRGVLRVCAATSVHLSSDASVPAGETPGLMMAIDHGAVEASFATGT